MHLYMSHVGQVKEVMQIALSMLIYHDNLTSQSIIGIIIALLATQCYQYIKLTSTKKTSGSSRAGGGGLGVFRSVSVYTIVYISYVTYTIYCKRVFRSPFPAHAVPFEQRQQARHRALHTASGPYSKFKNYVWNTLKGRGFSSSSGGGGGVGGGLSTIEEDDREDQASISTTPHSYSHNNSLHNGMSGSELGRAERLDLSSDDGSSNDEYDNKEDDKLLPNKRAQSS